MKVNLPLSDSCHVALLLVVDLLDAMLFFTARITSWQYYRSFNATGLAAMACNGRLVAAPYSAAVARRLNTVMVAASAH